jgi:DNA (cytosine-5)-methyltransferase 1
MKMLRTASLFCGAGGETQGKVRAFQQLGIPEDQVHSIALNHWHLAIQTHQGNFPGMLAEQEDVTLVTAESYKVTELDLLWASPSCVHHSRARGKAPKDTQERAHADEVLDRWVRKCKVHYLIIENVPEFKDWGPLNGSGSPIKESKGQLFQKFIQQLEELGYHVEWRILTAADYGDPTSRRRLFLQAALDGIVTWPEPTHRSYRKRCSPEREHLPRWRSAAECIDWSIPMRSIFGRTDRHGNPKELSDATKRRIAHGLMKHVVHSNDPFLVGRKEDLAAYTLIQTGYGERTGQNPRILSLTEPIPTVMAGGGKVALVAAFLDTYYTGTEGRSVSDPMGAVTTIDHHALVTATLSVSDENQSSLVYAFLHQYYSMGDNSTHPAEPLATVTTKDRTALVTVEVNSVTYIVTDICLRMLTPRELARAMGFPESFQFVADGKPLTSAASVRMIGNACPVNTVAALIRSMINARAGRFAN